MRRSHGWFPGQARPPSVGVSSVYLIRECAQALLEEAAQTLTTGPLRIPTILQRSPSFFRSIAKIGDRTDLSISPCLSAHNDELVTGLHGQTGPVWPLGVTGVEAVQTPQAFRWSVPLCLGLVHLQLWLSFQGCWERLCLAGDI